MCCKNLAPGYYGIVFSFGSLTKQDVLFGKNRMEYSVEIIHKIIYHTAMAYNETERTLVGCCFMRRRVNELGYET